MSTAYLATRISPHMARTPDGFLLCKDVVIARSGPLDYVAGELDIPGVNGAQRVTVDRPVDEVTSRRFLASAEGAPVTDAHPGRFVDPGNFQVYSRGHAQNVRVGPRDEHGNVTTIADLFIADGGLAERVESGAVRDVSIGYDLDLDKDGKNWIQKNLRVNHIAVVPKGRAGTTRIMDAAPELSFVRILMDSGEEIVDIEDLIDTEEEMPRKQSRDAALNILRKIRPEIVRSGTDAAKSAWNMLFVAIRDGANPQTALRNLRGHFGADNRVSAADSQDDARQAIADDLVASASAFLGQDIKEVAAHRRSARQSASDAEPQDRTVAEDLVEKAERVGNEMRKRRY